MRHEKLHRPETVCAEGMTICPQRRDQRASRSAGGSRSWARKRVECRHIALRQDEPDGLAGVHVIWRPQDAEEYDLQKSDDQLAEFPVVLVEKSQAGARQEKHRLTGANRRWDEREIVSQALAMPIQVPKVAPSSKHLSDGTDGHGPELRPVDRFVDAIDQIEQRSVVGSHRSSPGASSRLRSYPRAPPNFSSVHRKNGADRRARSLAVACDIAHRRHANATRRPRR